MLMLHPPSSTGVHPFDWVDDIIFILDAETRFTFVNAFALNAWNKRPGELLGFTFGDAVPEKATQAVMDGFRHALQTGQRTEFETFGLRHQGWINITVHPHQGGLIVQIKRLLRHAGTTVPADHDALTGCLTRATFQHALQTLTLPLVLAIVDLNGLKSVNTLRGHSGGDAHIRTVAHALREALPAEALICRWGGDEFVILTPGHDLEALRSLLNETNTVLPGPLLETGAFSSGLAVWDQDTAFERAFAIADEQLHLQKEHLREAVPGHHEADSFVTFSQELEALTDRGDVIQHALSRLLGLLDFDQAAYALIDGDHAFFSHQAHGEGVPAPQPALNVRVPLSATGLIDTVHRTRTTAWSTDCGLQKVHTAHRANTFI